MPVEITPLPVLGDNYIWVIRQGENAVVVDPGEAAPVEAWLREHALTLRAILVTHHHADHVGGLAALTAEHRAPVYGPALEEFPDVTIPLHDGDVVSISALDLTLRVIAVPGHTLGHIAYVTIPDASDAPYLFCGDTLFACGCGRLFEGSPAQMLASLDRLAALDEATRVCCAHEYTVANIDFALECEPANSTLAAWRDQATALRERGLPTVPTTIGHELQVNPFLRAGELSVQQQLAVTLDQPVAGRLPTFTLMREWKNRYPRKDIN